MEKAKLASDAKNALMNFYVPHASLSGKPAPPKGEEKNSATEENSLEHKRKRVRRKCTYVFEQYNKESILLISYIYLLKMQTILHSNYGGKMTIIIFIGKQRAPP